MKTREELAKDMLDLAEFHMKEAHHCIQAYLKLLSLPEWDMLTLYNMKQIIEARELKSKKKTNGEN